MREHIPERASQKLGDVRGGSSKQDVAMGGDREKEGLGYRMVWS